ncbi:MAG: hypothetical protein ACK48W_08200 [Bacteroidota bacterium]|jgi:hypothetical protein
MNTYAEPKSVLAFLHTYNEILLDLFRVQKESGYINSDVLNLVVKKHGHDIIPQLVEYRILRQLNSDFEIHSVYYQLMEYLLNEFKPLLPETIQKYHYSIASLFRKIRESSKFEEKILSNRITDLSLQIKEFIELVEKNTFKLLTETRELKSNVAKIDYREKVHKASFWIEYYIIPLNQILDVNQYDSVASKLYEVSEYVNQKRLLYQEDEIRSQFEKLYSQLIQVNDNLLRQSKILTNELLPLIERIKTESTILTGWIEFLKNPYKEETPDLLKSERGVPYSNNIYLNTKEFFEQYLNSTPTFIDEAEIATEKWIFDKELYKEKLTKDLPVDDFFSWCAKELKQEYKQLEESKFFSLTGLLFEEDLFLELPQKGEHSKIKTNDFTLQVPKIKINTHGLSEIPYINS